ncbi:hypothetical protein FS837_006955 [Tulasnella sp. UAMH 9824]|nr:hypothetical protein FS837_006955 [Tulasnella sp. UAMH 9824]
MIIARAARPVLARGAIRNTRLAHGHPENTVYNMPFDYRNPKTFAVKIVAYCGVGFAIPFIAAAYQMSKSAGADS